MNDSKSITNNHSLFTWLCSALRLGQKSTLKKSVEEAIDEHDATAGNAVDGGEKTMLRNVLTFAELNVEDVMIPRADIDGVDFNSSYEKLKKITMEKAHTRLPVYNNTMDDIAGFMHIKDLLSIAYDDGRDFDMLKLIRQCLFVPPSMKTSALLIKMQLSHVHMAIVVDEYGGTDGLVTLEDLVEEIVGEIADEHDSADKIMFTPLGEDVFEVSARMNFQELEKKLDLELYDGDEDFDTLGGLIFFISARVPVSGEVITTKSVDDKFNIEFEIIDADLRSIKRVRVYRTAIDKGMDG